MKPNSTIHFVRYLFISVFIVVFFILSSGTIYARNNLFEKKSTEIEDSHKTSLMDNSTTYFGFHTGVVITEDIDTGFGFGGRLTRSCFSPLLELTTSGYLWGASRDSLDVSIFGIEESLTLKKKHSNHISIFSGITAGYYFKNKKVEAVENNKLRTIEQKNYSLETFITFGGTYILSNNRSIFTQINYGLTQDTSETHILIGMIFFSLHSR